MGSKNKELAHTKRRQRAAVKAKERKTKKHVQPVSGNSLSKLDIGIDLFPDASLVFWLAHGVNCITSDYDKGTWTPLFEGIYTGQLPEPEGIAQSLMDKYNAEGGEWPPHAKAALAWTVQDRKVVYVYYKEALRRLAAAHGPEADVESISRQPHNPIVWALFAYLREKILRRK